MGQAERPAASWEEERSFRPVLGSSGHVRRSVNGPNTPWKVHTETGEGLPRCAFQRSDPVNSAFCIEHQLPEGGRGNAAESRD